MKAMHCRALGISALDLAGGVDLLKELEKDEGLTWLSANLVDPTGGKPIFSPSLRTKAGDTDITVLGLTEDMAARHGQGKFKILPWKEVLPELVKKAGDDMVILLSSYPARVNQEIARSVPGIDLILQSGHTPANRPPQQINATLLAQVAPRGKYLGMMRINWTEAGTWGDDATARVRAEQNRLDRINWQIGRMERRARGKDLSTDKRYNDLLAARAQSEEKIAALKKAREEAPSEPCTYTNRFIALKSSLPEDKEVQAIIDQTTREVNQLNKQRIRSSRRTGPHVSLSGLAGSEACRKCHGRQAAFWQTTGHAKAWQTLVDNDQQFNDNCLLCHTTLPYYDAAQVRSEDLLARLPEKLRNVGCESCHGPALAHSKTPETVRPSLPQEATCKQCHTPERDEHFIFAEKKAKIRCPKG
jgi:hypothetical protein